MVFEMVQRTTQACFECLAAARNSQCKVDFDPPLVCFRYLPSCVMICRPTDTNKRISASAHVQMIPQHPF